MFCIRKWEFQAMPLLPWGCEVEAIPNQLPKGVQGSIPGGGRGTLARVSQEKSEVRGRDHPGNTERNTAIYRKTESMKTNGTIQQAHGRL